MLTCISYKYSAYRKKEVLHSWPHLLQLWFSNLTVSQLHLFKGKVTMLSLTLCRALIMTSFITSALLLNQIRKKSVMSATFFIVIKLRNFEKSFFFSKCYLYSLNLPFLSFLFYVKDNHRLLLYFWNNRKNTCERKSE